MTASPVSPGRVGNVPLPIRLAGLAQNFGILTILAVVWIAVTIMNPSFSSAANMSNIAVNASILAVAGYGMTLAIAMGGFDLSVGSIQGLTAAVAAKLLMGHGVAIAVAAALAVGAAAGILNGAVITVLSVPPFVATLGTMSILLGIALLYTNGESIVIDNSAFGAINSGHLGPVPLPVVIALCILAALWAVFRHTPFGRHIAAVGGNRAAAEAAGIRAARITIAVFALVGLTAAISGVMVSAQLMNVTGDLGSGLALDAIAIAVLGGTSLQGGRGNLPGTLIAAFLLASISAGLNFLNVASFYQYLAVGILLVAALTIDSARRRLVLSMLRRMS